MGIDEPVIVGHSISSGIASIHASVVPVRGLVSVDGTVDIRPSPRSYVSDWSPPWYRSWKRFAAALRTLPTRAWDFRALPEPLRSQVPREPGHPPNGRTLNGGPGTEPAHRPLQASRQKSGFEEIKKVRGVRSPPRRLRTHPAPSASADCLAAPCHLTSSSRSGQDHGHRVHLAEVDRYATHLFTPPWGSSGVAVDDPAAITRTSPRGEIDEGRRARVSLLRCGAVDGRDRGAPGVERSGRRRSALPDTPCRPRLLRPSPSLLWRCTWLTFRRMPAEGLARGELQARASPERRGPRECLRAPSSLAPRLPVDRRGPS